MDILPILVAMLVAVAAVIVAGVFYSKAKVSEQEAANWKRSMAAQVDQQVAKAVADSKDALSAAERKSLELEGDNARLRSQLEAQQQSASRDLELAVGKARSELAGQVADAKEECQKLRDRISEFERDAMRSETDTQLKLAEKDRQIDIAKSDAEHEASRLRSEIENLKSSAHQAQEIAVNHAVSEANRKLTESEHYQRYLETKSKKPGAFASGFFMHRYSLIPISWHRSLSNGTRLSRSRRKPQRPAHVPCRPLLLLCTHSGTCCVPRRSYAARSCR